ncbi:Acyl-coenzyme A thioesterase 13 [Grifola frondosa]|uniref:Acyl-coenzyme A thioesterase 13 n=1 Tax=Grifola frondosa TaxID=5627 RepID=A0A1C7LZ43_GRIFR|nr:Acyl-coenzyme A thioesterase 13 [Grifola frondosa]
MVVDGVRFDGDIPPETKERIGKFLNLILVRGNFARSTGARLVPKEVKMYKRPEDEKPQVRVVFEITVDEDMLNPAGNVHGGCIVYMIDVCSSVALAALGMCMNRPNSFVSQALNTTFHAPAPLGTKLELVNTTTAFGGRTVAARTEIWDVTNRRLVASGVHNKMQPSQPKL